MNTKNISLRSFTPNDQTMLLEILTSPKVNKTYMLPDFEQTEDAIPLFRRLMDLSNGNTRYLRGIYLGERLIGYLNEVEKEGTSNVVIKFANGAMGYHFGTWGARGSSHVYDFQVHTEHGFFEYKHYDSVMTFIHNMGPDAGTGKYPRDITWNFNDTSKQTQYELNHFIDCVLNDKQPLTDPRSALESNRLIWKLYEAEEKGVVADLTDIRAKTEYLEVL